MLMLHNIVDITAYGCITKQTMFNSILFIRQRSLLPHSLQGFTRTVKTWILQGFAYVRTETQEKRPHFSQFHQDLLFRITVTHPHQLTIPRRKKKPIVVWHALK